MRECKVYKVREGMECQCIAEDSEVRLYLSPMRNRGTENREDSSIEKAAVMFINIFFAFSVAYFASLWAIPVAYMERGYKAYGGEWLFIMAVFAVAYQSMNQFFKYFRRKPCRKKK